MTLKISTVRFQKDLSALAAELRRVIETQVQGFDTDPAEAVTRRERVQTDYRFFFETYLPHYASRAPSALHAYLYARFPEILAEPKGIKEAIAGPRGSAKSTHCALGFPLWCILTGRKHYILQIQNTCHQAVAQFEAIKAELETNPRLKNDFPDSCGQGRVWREGIIVTKNDIKVQAFGAGQRLRGLRHGPHRPDLVLMDDIENDENVRSLTQRDKLESWLVKTVLPLGAADDTLDVLYIGTILHHDSVLARTLKNPLWQQRLFQAILEWPERMDLWDRWESTRRDVGETAALAFYQDRQAEMDRGAVVAWPSMQSLYALMVIRARDGHQAFDSEYQNHPTSAERNPFSGSLQFWAPADWSDDWLYFGAVDPSLGKSGDRGRDPSAILIGGFSRGKKILYVEEADIARRTPDHIIEDVIRYQRQYNCREWAVEAVQFQEFFRQELVKRSAQHGIPVPARPVIPRDDKDLRIQSLQPHCVNGLIKLHPRLRTLIDQLTFWPDADHDDGPDALDMLWRLVLSRNAPPPNYGLGGLARRLLPGFLGG